MEKIKTEKSFTLKTFRIKAAIREYGNYSDENIKVNSWVLEPKYFRVEIKNENDEFFGILNEKFQRNNYGIYTYSNGDVYIGNWENSKKERHGAYLFKLNEEETKVVSEMDWGAWENGIQNGLGSYIWKKEDAKNKNFDSTDMNTFLGEFKNQRKKHGIYMTKMSDNYYVYFGGFKETGQKNDENAFFYKSKDDRVFYGKVVDDEFLSGYLIYFNNEGEVLQTALHEFIRRNRIKLMEQFMKEDIEWALKTKVTTK
jgi:hypothetical protein